MARLRIFVSSTYYDLKHIRNSLELFIDSMGYESVLYESGDITFTHDSALDESCYREIENAHMQILIIGGRYGSPASIEPPLRDNKDVYELYNSITKTEFTVARARKIPIYFFVEKQVLSEYDTYKRNKDNKNVNYAHVDNVSIFTLIEDIYNLQSGNFIKGFEKFEDISSWLKDQWSGLFADYIKNYKSKIEIQSLSSRVDELNNITTTLKEYTQAIMTKIQPDNYENIIREQNKRLEHYKEQSFLKEKLIELLIQISDNSNVKNEIYSHFKATHTRTDFLKAVGATSNISTSVLKHIDDDYMQLIFKYKTDDDDAVLPFIE